MDGPRTPQPEDDPPPAEIEVDLEETVELDDGLDLEDWDAREKERNGHLTFASACTRLSASLKQPSTGLIIGIAYHLVAIAVFIFYAYMAFTNKLGYCADIGAMMRYPLYAGLVGWVISLVWMIYRLVLMRARSEPKEIELALIEAEELPDTEQYNSTRIMNTKPAWHARVVSGLKQVALALPYTLSVVLVLFVVAAIVALLYLTVHMALPPMSGTVTVQGLAGPARIEREANGLIHIHAVTARDVYFAQGIAMAQERLWQMEIQRRAGSGLLSEVLGSATLPVDIEMRTLGLLRASQRAAEALRLWHPEVYEGLEAFADGVNWYLDHDPALPFEFLLAGFKPSQYGVVDVLTMSKIMALDLGSNAGNELDRYEMGVSQTRLDQLWPLYPADAPTIVPNSDINQTLSRVTLRDSNYSLSSPASSSDSTPSPSSSSPSRPSPSGKRKARTTERSAWRRFRQGAGLASWTDASNNWVISGTHTASGKPILANDPHLGFSAPSIWILMHLHTDDGLNVIGACLPGVPGVVLGRNDHISWGITNVAADVQDMYIIVPAADPDYYLWREQMVAYNRRNESIPVKNEKPYSVEIVETVYGPIVNDVMDIEGPKMAFKWVGNEDNDTTPAAFFMVNRATSYEQWRDALRLFVAPSSNFIFADTEGNIAYQCTGRIPIRALGNGAYPVVSNSSEGGLWTGYIPYDELPYLLNPEEGFIVTANNKVIGNEYPYMILNDRDWEEAYRATRIRTMISDTIARSEKITAAHIQQWQSDQTTVMWSQNLRPILASLDPQALSTKAEKFRQEILQWDGNINATSMWALPYEDWYFRLAGVTQNELGRAIWGRPYFVQQVYTMGDVSCGQRAQCLAFAATAFEATAQKYAASSVTYGEQHTSLFAHVVLGDGRTAVGCLWDRSVPVGGDSYTVNPSSIRPSASAYVSRHGASYREIVDLAQPEQSQFIHPMGQSGSPFSEHYDDYLPLWASGQYIPMRTAGYTATDTFNLQAELPVADTAATTTASTSAASVLSTFTTLNTATTTGTHNKVPHRGE